MSMCRHHRRQYDGWLDYNEPITGWVQFGSSEDHRARMSVEVYNAKVEDQRKLIRDHLDGITELCRNRRGCSPRLLDLFSCAGGAGMGYYRAGFAVTGVDINPQPNYPFEFIQGDALDYLAAHGHEYDAIHASPPCQASCALTKGTNKGRQHINLIPQTREVLAQFTVPTVIENVQGSDLRRDLTLCGEMFGLRVIRHRYFEVNFPVVQPQHVPHRGRVAGYRHGSWYEGPYFAVYGDGGGKGTVPQWQDAMGIHWTSERRELAEAIPPAYTEYVGAYLSSEVAA